MPGWGKSAAATPADGEEEVEVVDLGKFESSEALAKKVGLDGLKAELTRLGLKVRGPRACARLA